MWKKIKEELPSFGKIVLCYGKTQTYKIKTSGKLYSVNETEHGKDISFKLIGEEYETDFITHWMELPEDPIE